MTAPRGMRATAGATAGEDDSEDWSAVEALAVAAFEVRALIFGSKGRVRERSRGTAVGAEAETLRYDCSHVNRARDERRRRGDDRAVTFTALCRLSLLSTPLLILLSDEASGLCLPRSASSSHLVVLFVLQCPLLSVSVLLSAIDQHNTAYIQSSYTLSMKSHTAVALFFPSKCRV